MPNAVPVDPAPSPGFPHIPGAQLATRNAIPLPPDAPGAPAGFAPEPQAPPMNALPTAEGAAVVPAVPQAPPAAPAPAAAVVQVAGPPPAAPAQAPATPAPAEPARPALRAYTTPAASTRGRTYDYRPAPSDHPLYALSPVRAPGGAVLPARVDLRDAFLPVREDGGCHGFAVAAAREALHALGTSERLPGPLSSDYVVARASGPCLADEVVALMRWGICPAGWGGPSGDAADVAALPFRVRQALPVDWSDPRAVKYALAARLPVMVTLAARASWEHPDDRAVAGLLKRPEPDEPVLGGVAAVVVGYDDAPTMEGVPGGWILRTTCGEDWGAGGHVYVPYGYEACWMEAWVASG